MSSDSAVSSNALYCGDNLNILRGHLPDSSVDLVYLDPPFKSDRNYHALFRHNDEDRVREKVPAFEDTWQWNNSAQAAYQQTVDSQTKLGDTLRAFHTFLGATDLLAYLSMLAPRLLQLHRVLNETGTIYLHCDPSASHYVKILMDSVFGPENMRNEIIWCYRGGGVPKKDFARKHDVILRYSKTESYPFNTDAVRIPYSDDVLNSHPSRYDKSYRTNKVYEGYRPNPAGKHPEDWWPLQAILPSSGERLGYPTQKPEALMERIIKASSNEDDLLLDPFCGSGTTLAVAERLGRKWIGIDVSEVAITVTKQRLAERRCSLREQNETS